MWRAIHRKGGSTISKKFIKKLTIIFDFLTDRKILMGIGIGMVLTSILMFGYSYNKEISSDKIEEKARGLGMHYDDECKVLFKGDESND